MKNKLASHLANNLGLKIAAVFFAVILWLIVVNVDDPVDSETFRNITVKVTNEEIVTNTGKIYQIVDDTQTVSVTVSAPRSVLSKISEDDIVAVADMREMELKTLVPIKAYVSGYEDKCEAVANPQNIQVKIEDQTKNTFPLTVETTGTLRGGYELGELKTNPETVTIRGAESLVGNVAKAAAKVDVSGLSRDQELTGELVLYDAEGNVIDQTLLANNLGEQGVIVSVQVLGTKSVSLNFTISGTPAEGCVYTGLSSEPEKIEICGTGEVLKQINSIDISAPELSVEGASERKEVVLDIMKYLPENVKLVDEKANNVIVTLLVEQEGVKVIEFPVESIGVNNLSKKLKISYGDVEEIQMRFRGAQEALNVLDIQNAVSIDLKNYYTAGTYEIPVSVSIPNTVEWGQQPVIKIVLTEKKGE